MNGSDMCDICREYAQDILDASELRFHMRPNSLGDRAHEILCAYVGSHAGDFSLIQKARQWLVDVADANRLEPPTTAKALESEIEYLRARLSNAKLHIEALSTEEGPEQEELNRARAFLVGGE